MIAELKDYDYSLPPELIASYPSAQRSDSRLLVYRAGEDPDSIEDRKFYELPEILASGDLLIFNNTRVSHRRLSLRRKSGGRVEALFLKNLGEKGWSCLLRGKSRLTAGERLLLANTGASLRQSKASKDDSSLKRAAEEAEFIFLDPQLHEVPEASHGFLLPVLGGTEALAWKTNEEAESFFTSYGEVPIPPYLGREAEELDRERYQNVYAERAGSVAAPTAGLHFSLELLRRLEESGIEKESLELSLGYGSFAPLQEENFKHSRLHTEEYRISASLAGLLNQDRRGRRIAVGTSTLRSLEANYREHGGRFVAGKFQTDLFLRPPGKLYTSQGLITNFHLPASSLLLLTAAYIGKERVLRLYKHAVQNRYRFFSYGDAMLILL